MALDENKRPIICTHENVEAVEDQESFGWQCAECKLRFRIKPQKRRKFSRERSQ